MAEIGYNALNFISADNESIEHAEALAYKIFLDMQKKV